VLGALILYFVTEGLFLVAHQVPWGFGTMSKLYTAFLVIASQFAMAALGMLILVAITDIGHLAAPAVQYYGMNRWGLGPIRGMERSRWFVFYSRQAG
jgi:hypothetical protein